MSQITISSFITNNGQPATQIKNNDSSYPRIRIWQVTNGSSVLLVGSPNGSQQNTDGTMNELTDGTSQDGFYTFVFDDTLGYNINGDFVVRVDGGPTIPYGERYQSVEVSPSTTADAVWEADSSSYGNVSTMGGRTNATFSNSQQLLIDVSNVTDLINLLIKYDTNRTYIDVNEKVLIVYDNDGQTELRRFELYDSTGTLNINEVAERRPVSATDGKPVL